MFSQTQAFIGFYRLHVACVSARRERSHCDQRAPRRSFGGVVLRGPRSTPNDSVEQLYRTAAVTLAAVWPNSTFFSSSLMPPVRGGEMLSPAL